MDEVLPLFLAETREALALLDADLLVLARRPRDEAPRARARRVLHTLKGSCGFLGLDDVAVMAHRGEDILDRDGPAAALGAVVDEIAARLDGLGDADCTPDAADPWAGLPALADDLRRALGKDFAVVLEDGGLAIDTAEASVIRGALPHLIRNAADHGLESEADRRRAGKPPRGMITITAAADGDRLSVTVRDDGRGLDLAALRRAGVARGLRGSEALSAADAAALIFRPGLSTAAAAGLISGRGVGLDAVKHAIEAAGGHVTVASGPDGTAITLALPRRTAAPARAA